MCTEQTCTEEKNHAETGARTSASGGDNDYMLEIVSQLFTDPIVHSCCFDRFYSIFQHSSLHKFSCFAVIDLNINVVNKIQLFFSKLQDILQTFSL